DRRRRRGVDPARRSPGRRGRGAAPRAAGRLRTRRRGRRGQRGHHACLRRRGERRGRRPHRQRRLRRAGRPGHGPRGGTAAHPTGHAAGLHRDALARAQRRDERAGRLRGRGARQRRRAGRAPDRAAGRRGRGPLPRRRPRPGVLQDRRAELGRAGRLGEARRPRAADPHRRLPQTLRGRARRGPRPRDRRDQRLQRRARRLGGAGARRRALPRRRTGGRPTAPEHPLMSALTGEPLADPGRLDRIEVTGIRAWAHHGVLEDETRLGQQFLADVTLHLSTAPAGRADALGRTVNYAELAHAVHEELTAGPWALVETLAERIAERILPDTGNPLVRRLGVRAHKPAAPVGLPGDDATLSIQGAAPPVPVVLALGTHLGDRAEHLRAALELLAGTEGIEVDWTGPVLETAPVGGPAEQGAFLNSVIGVRTALGPFALLETAHRAE